MFKILPPAAAHSATTSCLGLINHLSGHPDFCDMRVSTMKGPLNLLARVSALLVLAGLAVSVISTAPWGAANAVAQDKKDRKDKDKDKDKDKKKEIPKDKTPPALVLKGHKDWINYAGFSPDGKYLITASRDKTVKIWDLKDGKDIATLKDHPTEVRFALFSPRKTTR
jgi:WD40 repeat protein